MRDMWTRWHRAPDASRESAASAKNDLELGGIIYGAKTFAY